MNKTEESRLLQQMIDIIVNEVNPETIILFGSRGRGDARPDSDVDLLIVESEPFSPQRTRFGEINRVYMALKDMPLTKDVLLYSRDEFEKWKTSLNHVIGRAYREGRVLHERH
jgi:uncharacterized protein